LRTGNARYEAISDRAVRVSGSEFANDSEYTIKLEGVRHVGYSTILMGGVRDPYILAADRQLARAARRQHQDAHPEHSRRTCVRGDLDLPVHAANVVEVLDVAGEALEGVEAFVRHEADVSTALSVLG
jgi:hypothetical protein